MAYTQLIPQHTRDARVEEISRESSHYLLSIPSGKSSQYRLAQLDDYAQIPRREFPHHPPVSLTLSARASSDSIPGTWGFGFWNHPFGLSLGFGGTGLRLPTLPNTVWFFGASEENYLSFQEGYRPARRRRGDRGAQSKGEPQSKSLFDNLKFGENNAPLSAHRERLSANGFLAQSFRAPGFHPLLVSAGLAVPFSRRQARRLLGKVIREDGIQLWSPAARRASKERTPRLQCVDPTQWHRYRLDWRERQVSFEVDDASVFQSTVSPRPPLGLVIWIDNQYAAFTPEGKIGFGVLENPEPAWLEVKEIEVIAEANSVE